MPASIPHDPATLDYCGSGGKKHYNPYPRSRIPSTRRATPKQSPVVRRTSSASRTTFTSNPVYLLSVPSGQELAVAAQLTRYSTASGVLVPRNHNNEPLLSGYILLAIPTAEYHTVTHLLQTQYWGWLSRDPLDADVVQSFLPYMGDPLGDASLAWGSEHPVRQIAEAVLQSQGLHGVLESNGWALQDKGGVPIVQDRFADWWTALIDDWESHRPLREILERHHAYLLGHAFPLVMTGYDDEDLVGHWFGQPARIAAKDRQGIRVTSSRPIWGVLTGRTESGATFSLTHPDLLHQRLAYRIVYDAAVRDPGRWAAILVPRTNPMLDEHVRLAARSLGWSEAWRIVHRDDPAGVVRTLLKPRTVRFDRRARVIHVEGIDVRRRVWLATAQEWLPDWVIAG